MIRKQLRSIAITAVTLFASHFAGAQGMAVNTTGAAANSSAILDVSSTTQGVLIPRMTAAQRSPGISSPVAGLLVYQTDGSAGFYYYTGSAWVMLDGGVAGGDLTGSYPNPTVAAGAITGTKIAANTITTTNLPAGATGTNFLRGDNTWATPSTIPSGTAGGNLGGTYPNPSIASLPAISGASLTNLTPANLTAGGTFPAENGSNLTNLPAASLTGTISATALPTSGVTAGTYGSSTAIPSITVDDKGRVTAVTTNTVTASGGGGGGFFFNTTTMAALPGTTPVYGPLTQVPAANTTSPYPMNTTNGSFLTVAQACTLDAMYVMGVCRMAGTTSNTTETFTVYKNASPTSLTGSFTISGLGTVNQAFTPVVITGASVSVSPGDVLYIQWTNSNPATGPLANAAWSIHAQ